MADGAGVSGQWNLSDEARIVTASMFKTLAFAAETFLFAYIGLSAVTFSYDNALALSMCAFALCLIGRALNIFPLSLIVNQFRSKKISMKVHLRPLPPVSPCSLTASPPILHHKCGRGQALTWVRPYVCG